MRLGRFYPKLAELLFPFRDPRPAAFASTAVVWCPVLLAAAAVALLIRARRHSRPASPAAAVWVGFAAANLTQLTASCHAPYLFPAAATAFLVAAGPVRGEWRNRRTRRGTEGQAGQEGRGTEGQAGQEGRG